MRNENGESRGFGFVSYQTPDQGMPQNRNRSVHIVLTCAVAANAMHGMNGMLLGTKQLVVRLHEPKQLRQEKLAARFGGHNGHPRSGSGATSPAASDIGESYWPSPNMRTSALGSPVLGNNDRPDRARRSSGSYYHVSTANSSL